MEQNFPYKILIGKDKEGKTFVYEVTQKGKGIVRWGDTKDFSKLTSILISTFVHEMGNLPLEDKLNFPYETDIEIGGERTIPLDDEELGKIKEDINKKLKLLPEIRELIKTGKIEKGLLYENLFKKYEDIQKNLEVN